MIKSLNADAVRRHRAKRLGLFGKQQDIIQLADANCGLHGTSFLTPYLSLMAREVSNPFQALNQAQLQKRELIRMRAMRGTLFILPTHRISLMLGIYRAKPRILQKFYEDWNVAPQSVIRHKKTLLEALNDSPRSLKELKNLFPEMADTRVTSRRAEKQMLLTFMLQELQMEGRVSSEKIVAQNTVKTASRYFRIVTTYKNIRKPPPEEECLRELVHWYFDNLGPASLEDLAWWSGLSRIALKKVLPDFDLMEIEIKDTDKRLLITPGLYQKINRTKNPENCQVKLLPYEDPYLNGQKDRSIILHGVPAATVFERGEARPTICVDGRVVGLWRYVEHGDDLRIGVELFDAAVIDPERLNKAKEAAVSFALSHFQKCLDKFAMGIFTGTEPYA